jgi:hypothetical protein
LQYIGNIIGYFNLLIEIFGAYEDVVHGVLDVHEFASSPWSCGARASSAEAECCSRVPFEEAKGGGK